MQKLLWIGEKSFSPLLCECGWELASLPSPKPDDALSWEALCQAAGFEPDVLVAAAGEKAPLQNIAALPCLTVLYVPHINAPSWAAAWADSFDACLISASDHLAAYSNGAAVKPLHWSPPYGGGEGPALIPHPQLPWLHMEKARFNETEEKFINELGMALQNVPEERRPGQADLVLRLAPAGKFDHSLLNLMTHHCVVTPRVGNGLERLFVDGEHFVGYADMDAGDAAYRISFLLEHPDIIGHIAQTAKNEISAKHLAIHRAEAFTDFLCDLLMNDPDALIAKRLNK